MRHVAAFVGGAAIALLVVRAVVVQAEPPGTLAERVADLERRLAKIEAASVPRYERGVEARLQRIERQLGIQPASTASASEAKLQMLFLATAIDLYYLENRAFPKSLDELTEPSPTTNVPYVKQVPLDPWKEQYEYKVTNPRKREYTISSAGEDRQWGTDDDLVYPERDASK